jgi:hypothetical protein
MADWLINTLSGGLIYQFASSKSQLLVTGWKKYLIFNVIHSVHLDCISDL